MANVMNGCLLNQQHPTCVCDVVFILNVTEGFMAISIVVALIALVLFPVVAKVMTQQKNVPKLEFELLSIIFYLPLVIFSFNLIFRHI